jgi:hypothetical protein
VFTQSGKSGQLETEVHAARDLGYEQCVTWGQKALAYKWVPNAEATR